MTPGPLYSALPHTPWMGKLTAYHHGSIPNPNVIEVEPLLARTLMAIWKHQEDIIMQATIRWDIVPLMEQLYNSSKWFSVRGVQISK